MMFITTYMNFNNTKPIENWLYVGDDILDVKMDENSYYHTRRIQFDLISTNDTTNRIIKMRGRWETNNTQCIAGLYVHYMYIKK